MGRHTFNTALIQHAILSMDGIRLRRPRLQSAALPEILWR